MVVVGVALVGIAVDAAVARIALAVAGIVGIALAVAGIVLLVVAAVVAAGIALVVGLAFRNMASSQLLTLGSQTRSCHPWGR